jgi:hypothetical protein
MGQLTSNLVGAAGNVAENYGSKLPTISENTAASLLSLLGVEDPESTLAVYNQYRRYGPEVTPKVGGPGWTAANYQYEDPNTLTATLTWVGDKIEAMGARIESALQGAVVQLDGEKVGQVVLGWIDDKASTAMVAYGP